MKFGVCMGLDEIEEVAKAGFDYLEPAVVSTLKPEDSAADVLPVLQAHLGLPALAFNLFLPADLKIVGETIDRPRLEHYVQEAFRRASLAGAKVIVLGSGGARRIPDGFPRFEAERQLSECLKLCAAAGERFGVRLAIEALNTRECNFVNSVAEAAEFARRCGSPSVGVVSDLYHILMDSQTFEETLEAHDVLMHVHVSSATERQAPQDDDLALLTKYFQVLKRAGYDGLISVEAQWRSVPEQGAPARAVLEKAWASA
ncbi:MAG: Sugar phosphate isomerase/epimerase [Capsulimonas sp.]|nr:Sugar phosphate isomerase/epimerase [Capsulimonas sp.]